MEYLFNIEFAKQRGVTEDGLVALQEVYKQLHGILKRPSHHCEDPEQAVDVIQGLEYTLQMLWGFPLSRDFHSYWFEVEGCTCLIMDNRELFGTALLWRDVGCPYHGESKAKDWEDGRFK